MDQKSFWHTKFLIIFCLFFLTEMINPKYLDFPLANLSTSWINSPSYGDFNISLSSFTLNSSEISVSPILYRGSSNGSQFMTGFYCQRNETITANCFFGILLFQSNDVGDINVALMNDPQLIWSPNRDHPVHTNSTLDLTKSGDIILKDADGELVWSAYTGGKNAVVLNLTEMGNLLLFNGDGNIVWQSFDYPTDILVPDQTLTWKQSLISSSSLNNFSPGLYSLVISYNVSTYIQSDPPQNYLSLGTYDLYDDQYIPYDGQILTYMKALASTTAEFMRLDSDGHLRIYRWDVFGSTWKVFVDVFAKYIDDCGYPLACGEYGICSSGQCSCPDEANIRGSSFRPINSRQPNFGCTPVTSISCNSGSHSLLELKNTSYLNKKQGHGLNITLEDCKNRCLRNCSCKAAFFVYGMVSDSSRHSTSYNGCLLVSEVFSLKNTDGYSEDLAFLKVESSPSYNSYSHLSISRIGIIIAGSIFAAFLGAISLIAFLIFLLKRKNDTEEHDEISFNHVAWIPTRFSYDDMKSITNNFLSKLGQGGFGSVFEGTLRDGTTVAVKRLDGVGHIKKSFLAEVESIGSIHHVNLVQLIGFCAEKSNLLLVYEYMPKGSLDKWIFQKNKELSLDWEPRKKIILDIAKGLAYLHEDCRCKILHLDIKPQNILLGENLNAKVSDFGLAKLLEKDQSQVMTNLRGTPGYLAPEWLSSIITEKVDVYSFGIVVLEILCGRRNVDRSQPEEDMHLLTLFKRKIEEGTLEDIVDMSNQDMLSHLDEIVKMMKIAKWCLRSNYSLRPSMAMVVKTLEDSLNVENNLAYEFTSSMTIAPGAPPEVAFDCTTLFPPISLSGPR